MSIASAPSSQFEQLTAQAGDELASTALAAAAQAGDDQRLGSLIIVVHPERDSFRVLSTSGVGVLRAAVSVALASGNDRLWADAPANGTIERSVRSLPEVIRAAAEASLVVTTHTGIVRVDDRVEAVAIWFESDTGAASAAHRRTTLELLAAAAKRDAEQTVQAASATPATGGSAGGSADAAPAVERREIDQDDPDVDPVTGLANRERFDRALENHESDQASLIVLDIDRFRQIVREFGVELADRVLLETADRLIDGCRRSDLAARIDTDTFALLLNDVDRATALQISKRLLTKVAEPQPAGPGPDAITATVALAHQFGLVDTEELMQSASDAMRSGKKSGGGHLFIGS